MPWGLVDAWWFWALLGLAAVGIPWAISEWRVARVERERARLETMVRERTLQLEEANARLAAANAQLEALSRTDPLTLLWNRRYVEDRIARDVAQVLRLRAQDSSRETAIVFLLIDIDHFKRINDTHGHEVGDMVLVETARRLRKAARASDYVVRWGGEEFLFIACFSPAADAPRIAERVMEVAWGEPMDVPLPDPVEVTGSIGVSVFPLDGPDGVGDSWERAIARADEALYRAKQEGRNRWVGPRAERPVTLG